MIGVPTAEPAKRLHTLFNRRATTAWSVAEIRVYKQLVKDGLFLDLTDLTLVEQYHNSERKKGKDGIHRRELLTFLTNFRGELDRAREWNARKTNTRGRITVKKNGEKPLGQEEFKRIGTIAIEELRRCRESLGRKELTKPI